MVLTWVTVAIRLPWRKRPRRGPVPGQPFVEAIDLVIVDATWDVSQASLRIKAVHLGGCNDGHGARQGFGTAVRAREEPVLPGNSNRTQGALGRIVVDGDAAVLGEQAEARHPAQAVTEGPGRICLARDAGQLLFGPGKERLDLWPAVRPRARHAADQQAGP